MCMLEVFCIRSSTPLSASPPQVVPKKLRGSSATYFIDESRQPVRCGEGVEQMRLDPERVFSEFDTTCSLCFWRGLEARLIKGPMPHYV